MKVQNLKFNKSGVDKYAGGGVPSSERMRSIRDILLAF